MDPLGFEQSLRQSALWDASAAQALDALRALGLWRGEAPHIRVARRQPGWAGSPPARWAKATAARAARALSRPKRADPDLAAAAYAQALSALALCGPERALVVPLAWVERPPHRAWGFEEECFRVAICAHELAHLALDGLGDRAQAAQAVWRMSGPPCAIDVGKALWPRHPDDEWAGLQARWRGMLVEGFADCAACLACERAGFGPAAEMAERLARARQAPELANQGAHDTAPALRELSRLLGPTAQTATPAQLCARASREGLARAIQAQAEREPFGEAALLAGSQGALPKRRP